MSNKFGFRAVVISGSLLGFVGLLTSTFALSVGSLFFTLGVLFGIADGLVYTPIVVGVGFYFDKRRALATGITLCGSGVGTFVFAPLIYWLLETYAIRGTFLILVTKFFKICLFAAFSQLLAAAPLTIRKFIFKEWDLFELCSFWRFTNSCQTCSTEEGNGRSQPQTSTA